MILGRYGLASTRPSLVLTRLLVRGLHPSAVHGVGNAASSSAPPPPPASTTATTAPTTTANEIPMSGAPGLAPFPSHYLSHVSVLDTRHLDRIDAPVLATHSARIAMALRDWASLSSSDKASSTSLESAGDLLDQLHHVLLLHARTGNTEMVTQLIQLASTAGLPLDARIHNDRLLALCRARSSPINTALTAFHDMKAANLANGYSLAIMVDGLCKHGRVYRALELLDDWDATAPSPSLRVQQHHRQQQQLQIPQPAFTSILAGLARSRDYNACWKLYHRMQLNHSLPDEVTYSTMISVCASTGDVEKALSMFDTMRASNMFPTTATINALLMAMSKRKDYAPQALHFYSQCLAADFVPDDRSMAYLMGAARRAQNWTHIGTAVWAEATRRDLVTDHVRAQALWAVSVEQAATRQLLPQSSTDTILAGLDRSALPLPLANAFLATHFPYAGDAGLAYFFDHMPVKDGMSYRLALSYCMELQQSSNPDDSGSTTTDASLDVQSAFADLTDRSSQAQERRKAGVRVWKAWEQWYDGLQASCSAHVSATRKADAHAPRDAVAAAYLASHTMTRAVLYKLVSTMTNGIAVDSPRRAVALLFKYVRDRGVRIDRADFARLEWHVNRVHRSGDDPEVLGMWEGLVEQYSVKADRLGTELKRLRRKKEHVLK
ncbi:hypothetical protein BC828DRAFT_403428 [Blastocladiella britannica]|nr:hypothetical protein BC828DRAFT_403428 [Blastocladiella britannica]